VTAVHMVRLDEPAADWESFWGSLTVEVEAAEAGR